MKILKISNSGLVEVDAQTFQQENDKVLFLGGLLHVNNISLSGGLPKMLEGLCPHTSIFTVYDDQSEGVSQTVSYMKQFIEEGKITSFAREIADLCALPLDVDVHTVEAKDHFASLKLIGYSYGASLVQQISQIVASDMHNRFIQKKSIDPVGATVALLQNVKAINIGPDTILHEMDHDGSFVPLRKADELHDQSSFAFNQMFFVNSVDKIVEMDVADYYAIGKNSRVIYDSNCDGFLKRVGFEELESGNVFPKIKYEYDFEGHHLGLYTNTLSYDGKILTYPSSSNSDLLRRAISGMISSSGIDDFDTLRSNVALESSCQSRKNDFLVRQKQFEDFISDFQNQDFVGGVKTIEALIDSIVKPAVRAPSLRVR